MKAGPVKEILGAWSRALAAAMETRWPRAGSNPRHIGVAHWTPRDWLPDAGNHDTTHIVFRMALEKVEQEVRSMGQQTAEGSMALSAFTSTARKLEQWSEPQRRCGWCIGFSHDSGHCQSLQYYIDQVTVRAHSNLWDGTFKPGMILTVDALLHPASQGSSRRRGGRGNNDGPSQGFFDLAGLFGGGVSPWGINVNGGGAGGSQVNAGGGTFMDDTAM
jgi:hypothetical protein